MSRLDDELRAQAAAYALDALDDLDRARFERALADSPELQAEVDAFRAAAATGFADGVEPAEPPASLKAGLFARLDDAPQVGRETGSTPDATSDAPAETTTDDLARRRSRRRLALVISVAASLLLVAAGVAVGLNLTGPNGFMEQRELAAITSAPDAETLSAEMPDGGRVTLVWSQEQARSAVRVTEMPDPGESLTYQLWYLDESSATPAGTLDLEDGEAWRVLDGELTADASVGITVEPAGGSAQPTSDPIVVLSP